MNGFSVILCGASGRMGKELIELCLNSPDARLVGACTRSSSAWIGKDIGTLVGTSPSGILFVESVADVMCRNEGSKPVIIDFSAPDALPEHVEAAMHFRLPILVGTSGVLNRFEPLFEKASRAIPVLVAPSTSIVANLVAMLSGIAAQILEKSDIEISEIHHRHKKDSPSGTAYFLANHIAQSRGLNPSEALCFNRYEGGPRKHNEIGVFGLRGGSVVGTHTVNFFDDDETLEIVHRTHNRRVFAVGAISAARFLSEQPAGLYNMMDVFKMNPPGRERIRK